MLPKGLSLLVRAAKCAWLAQPGKGTRAVCLNKRNHPQCLLMLPADLTQAGGWPGLGQSSGGGLHTLDGLDSGRLPGLWAASSSCAPAPHLVWGPLAHRVDTFSGALCHWDGALAQHSAGSQIEACPSPHTPHTRGRGRAEGHCGGNVPATSQRPISPAAWTVTRQDAATPSVHTAPYPPRTAHLPHTSPEPRHLRQMSRPPSAPLLPPVVSTGALGTRAFRGVWWLGAPGEQRALAWRDSPSPTACSTHKPALSLCRGCEQAEANGEACVPQPVRCLEQSGRGSDSPGLGPPKRDRYQQDLSSS